MQHKAAKVTQDWSWVLEGDDIRLGMAVWQSYELMRDLEEDLGDHKSDCAEALSRPTVRIFRRSAATGRVKNAVIAKRPSSIRRSTRHWAWSTLSEMANVRQNGFAISFVAHFNLLTMNSTGVRHSWTRWNRN